MRHKLHILGIGGTFMGSLAQIAAELGYQVQGSDAGVYPPMSDQLAARGIGWFDGYRLSDIDPEALVIVGNAISRGNPAFEGVLNRRQNYVSGPQWLCDHLLKDRWVLAVAGTHGKTTTSSMLAWILEHAGMKPGFLIGGVPQNFGCSGRLGDSPFFVIEADEYDSALFDKRSKFLHYRPNTLIINNIEYDHADIFPDLAAIERQFHHLVRTLPNNGRILCPAQDASIERVLAQGCWSEVERLEAPLWQIRELDAAGSRFDLWSNGNKLGEIRWSLLGHHNVANALSAIAAARHAGVKPVDAIAALNAFEGVKRRLELRGCVNQIEVYDDFAHHPTAIATTLAGLKARLGPQRRILAVMEPRSNTMKLGVHRATLAASFRDADAVYLYEAPDLGWSMDYLQQQLPQAFAIRHSVDELVSLLARDSQPGDAILVMSNGGFGGIHGKLLHALASR